MAVKDYADSLRLRREVDAAESLLIELTSRLSLTNLDEWERLVRWEFSSASGSSVRSKRKSCSDPSSLQTWIFLCDGNGYKREKALRELNGAAPSGFFFALAMRRLNDWVPQVREAAEEKLPAVAKLSAPQHVAEALCTALAHWNSWGRIEKSGKRVLLGIVSDTKISQALKSKIIKGASGPLATVFAQAGRTPALDEYLGEIAKNAVQPSVRAKAYRSQLENKMVWREGREWEWIDIRYCKGRFRPILSQRKLTTRAPFLDILDRAAVDRSPVVRRVAAEMLIRKLEFLGEESLRLAKLFSTDTSPSIAERGAFALTQLKAR